MLGIHLRQRVRRHFAIDIFKNSFAVLGTQRLDDVRQVGRMHILQQAVRNIQAQTALRIRLQNVAELPANRVRRNAPLQTPDPKRWNDPAQQPPENAADADIDLQHPQDLRLILLAPLKRHVVDANHLAPLRIDNLLIQKIARKPQHVFVRMVRREIFIAQMDAIERYGFNLIVTDRQQRPVAANQEAVDANRVDQRHNRGVFNPHRGSAP